jgi:predicted flap endonuclease-1-like 5' DNA nuclease
MRHHASLVSPDIGEAVEVTLDVSNDTVGMFVAETSVGQWPVDSFIAAPAETGFRLPVEGESWSVQPRDRALFLADTVPRTPLWSRARLANTYPRLTRFVDSLRSGSGWYYLVRLLILFGLSIGSFGLGVIIGRYRVDGGNASTWISIVAVLAGSILVGRLVLRGSSPERAGAAASGSTTEPDTRARLLSTLHFEEPPGRQERTTPMSSTDEHMVAADDNPIAAAVPEDPIEAVPRIVVDLSEIGGSGSGADASEVNDDAHAHEPVDTTVNDLALFPVVDNGRIHLPRTQRPAVNRSQNSSHEPRVHVINVEPADDLTEIHGIGPTFASILTSLGITTFRSLAAIDDETLAAVRSQLGPFAGRIERDAWIEAATEAERAKSARGAAPATN